MTVTLQLITQARDDLFDVSAALCAAIEPAFLADKDHPVILALNGHHTTGKKLVADTMRRELLSSTFLRRFSGRYGYDEYWKGRHASQPIEIHYIDAGYTWGRYKRRELSKVSVQEKQSTFLRLRNCGGLSVIQNHMSDPESTDVSMKITVQADSIDAETSTLAESFDKALLAGEKRRQKYSNWLRLVTIEVDDPRLTASTAFMQALKNLGDSSKNVMHEIMVSADSICKDRRYSHLQTPQPVPAYEEFQSDAVLFKPLLVKAVNTWKSFKFT